VTDGFLEEPGCLTFWYYKINKFLIGMDEAFFIGLSLIYLIVIVFIIKMIRNRMRGNDELGWNVYFLK